MCECLRLYALTLLVVNKIPNVPLEFLGRFVPSDDVLLHGALLGGITETLEAEPILVRPTQSRAQRKSHLLRHDIQVQKTVLDGGKKVKSYDNDIKVGGKRTFI